jgi:DNA-binding GntR family transcriptional regulator
MDELISSKRTLYVNDRNGSLPAADRASLYIREMIFDGKLRQGDQLDQQDICNALSVSRQPVREAILEIAAEGLLVVRPRHGVFVGPFNERTIRETCDLYGHLRGYAASRVAASRDAEAVKQLAKKMRDVQASVGPHDFSYALDAYFQLIVTAADNLRLGFLLQSVARFVPQNFFDRFPKAIPPARRSCANIQRAIQREDAVEAAIECEVMWRRGGDYIVTELKANKVLP